jgi:hypothetical protein
MASGTEVADEDGRVHDPDGWLTRQAGKVIGVAPEVDDHGSAARPAVERE